MKNYLNMSSEQIENFGQEIESIYIETKAKLGQEDLDHILKMKALSNSLEVGGRALIHVSKDPLTWMSGVTLLGYHYLLEFTELGHNILHGHYDDIPHNTTVNSKTWKWDSTMDEEDWKFEHHVVHHPFTNVIAKDNDFGFLVYRVNDAQKWKPHHLFQVPMLLTMPLINSFFFPWYVATSRALAESREVLTWETYLPSIKQIAGHLFKNYILFPFLPGTSYLKVAAGNFFAKLFQNFYLEMILAISHLHKDAFTFEDIDNETKGEFYLRQVLATINFDSPAPYDIVYGAINLHIEHHLFPDLPPNRLREVAPKVKAVCEKYGVSYRSGSFPSQFRGVIENAILRSLPLKPEENGDIGRLIQNPVELISRILDGTKNLGEIFSRNEYSKTHPSLASEYVTIAPKRESALTAADSNKSNIFHTVMLIRSKKEIRVDANTTLLDAIENAGIPITSGCRKGLCKSCQVMKVSGYTHNELYPNSKNIRITTCNSLARSDIELDI